MKKLMQNDMFLRVLSVVIAFLCWVYIIIITNPEIEVKISGIPITLADQHTIKSEGYIVSNEINATVDIKVKGSRKMLANIDRDSVSAYVNLTDCTDKKTYELPVNIRLPYQDISLVSKSVHKISVDIDNYITREFPVNYVFNGELKDKNYTVHETVLQTPKVEVSGPESTIKTIEKAVIEIQLAKAFDDVSGYAPVKLLNSNNAEVSLSGVDVKNQDISYKCIVYSKKSVEVKPVIKNGNGGFKITVTDYPVINISGPASDINKIEYIETKPINTNGLSMPHEFVVSLIVPENVNVEEDISTVDVLVDTND